MTHGVRTQPSLIAKDLVNPPPKTLVQQRVIDKKEGIYLSHQKKPLGEIPDQTLSFPVGFDRGKTIFGIKTVKGKKAFLLMTDRIR